jgi:hypothetical protein
LNFTQLHGGLDEFYLGRGQETAVSRLLDHDLEFFGGAHQCVAVGRDYPHGANHFFGDAVEKIDGPAERVQEPLERACDEKRDTFGAREAEALRNELAQDNLKNRQEAECDDESNGVRQRGSPGTRNGGNQWADNIRQRHLAEITERKAGQRDSYLHAGDDAA